MNNVNNMDDKQRLYERLTGISMILNMLIKLNEDGEEFDTNLLLNDISNSMAILESEGCSTHTLDVVFNKDNKEGDNEYEICGVLQ